MDCFPNLLDAVNAKRLQMCYFSDPAALRGCNLLAGKKMQTVKKMSNEAKCT